jgi:hypothetical protein
MSRERSDTEGDSGERSDFDDVEKQREYEERLQESNIEHEETKVAIQKPQAYHECCRSFAPLGECKCAKEEWSELVKEAAAIERNAWIEALKWCFFVSPCEVTHEHIEDKLRELEEMGNIEFKKVGE